MDVFASLDPVLDGIGSREPAPGGGSTAALVGAMAAALCAKAARFTNDDGATAQAEHLRRRLTALAREDAEAFVRALRDLDEPRDPDPDRRDWQLGRSLAAAADVPLRIAETCADVAELAAHLAHHGKPELQPDAAGAAVLAEAAARVCAHLVAINLGATNEDARVRHAESLAATARQAVARAGARAHLMPPLAAVPNLEHELDELYGLPLDDWTRARNDLAARLKKAHQAEQAEHVRSLRKPSIVAWTVNQLARRERKRVDALLRAGERLRAAQEQALRGKATGSDVNAAARAERDAVRDLVSAARGVLEEAGNPASPGTIDRVSQTLRAAALDDTGRELLARGRFDEELKGAGFGTLTALKPAAAARPRKDELKAARERVNALRAEARRLAAEAREAETEAARAERDAEHARERAQAKREEAEAAATKLADAEAALTPRR